MEVAGLLKGPPLIEIIDEPPLDPNPAPHPEYGYNGTPRPSVCATIAPAESWMVGVKKAQDFGNGTFGAGYELFLGIEGKAASGSRPSEVNAGGRARASVTFFHQSTQIALLEAMGHATSGKEATADITVNIVGIDVYKLQRQVALNWKVWRVQQDFFNVQASIQVGPIPVVLGVGAGGVAGVDVNVPFTTNSIGLQARPYANVYASRRAATSRTTWEWISSSRSSRASSVRTRSSG